MVKGMSFSQKYELQLNEDTKVIIMKPGQDLYFRYAPRMDELLKTLFENKEDRMSWVKDEKKYKFVTDFIKPVLMFCLRNPENYKKRLLVDNDEKPTVDQEYYDDFNPVVDSRYLKKTPGFYAGEDNENILTPQLTLFFGILRKSGWLNISNEEVEEVESFPDDGNGDEETPDNGVVQGV